MSKVQDACAFLGDGMARIDRLEEQVHGRQRRSDEMYFGVAVEVRTKKNGERCPGPVSGGKETHLEEPDCMVCYLLFLTFF